MPTISVKRDLLFEALGKTYSDDEFQRLCFEFGLELDEVTSEKQMITKEKGDVAAVKEASDEILYKIDIPANRYDLLCLEGLVTALLIFQKKMLPPQFKLVEPSNGQSRQQLKILSETSDIRPFAVAAVLRNIEFNEDSYKSFIDLQEKLHQNICRKRTLVAIGTHDLDKVQGPFSYEARNPENINFVPLNQSKEMNGHEIMEFYSTHAQLKQYLPIIKDAPLYPVIYDANSTVLSLPPIINGNQSKISIETRNIFIECTATDLTKAKIVLDTIVCMFSQYCKEKYTIEPCDVVSPDGTITTYPELPYRVEKISSKRATSLIGIDEKPSSIASMLTRMYLNSELDADDEDIISVTIPPTRSDILHACDIYEDIAIAFGFNNIQKTLPSFMTIAEQLPMNKLTEQLRQHVAMACFTEVLSFTLCSWDDLGSKMNKSTDGLPIVVIANPKSAEFQVVRISLLPGLLKTISSNRKKSLPLKIFEISDVVLLDKETEVGARNERRLCAVYCGKAAGFEIVHGLLDRVMLLLEVPWKTEYYLEGTEDSSYFPGRCANIMYKEKQIGRIGVIHPFVLKAFEISYPCSAVEFTIEPFV